MKILKILLVILAVLVCLALLALVVALNPGVQRYAFLKVVAAPGRSVNIDRVDAGFSGVTLERLAWTEDGTTTTIAKVVLKFPLMTVLGGRRLPIEEMTVDGLKLDLAPAKAAKPVVPTNTSETATAGGPGAAPAASQPPAQFVLKLPLSVSIEKISIAASALLPVGAKGRPHAELTIAGGGFGPGREGKLTLAGIYTDPDVAALARGTAVSGEVTVRETTGDEIDHAELHLVSPFLAGGLQAEIPEGVLAKARIDGSFSSDRARVLAFVSPGHRPAISQGNFKETVSVTGGGNNSVNVTTTTELSGLVGVGSEAPRVDRVAATLTATVGSSQPAMLEGSMTVTGADAADVSDVSFRGTAQQLGTVTKLGLALTSTRLSVPTLLRLRQLALPPTSATAAPPPKAPAGNARPPSSGMTAADTVPVWAGLAGTIDMKLARVELPSGQTVLDTKGSIKIDADKVALSGLEGVALGAPFHGAFELGFDTTKGGYAVTGDAQVEKLDVGKALQEIQPGSPPEIEGLFSTSTHFNAAAPTLAALAQAPAAEISLHGDKGVFRGLKQRASNVSAGLGLIGGLVKSDKLQGITQLASDFAAIAYDRLDVKANVTTDGTVTVENFLVQSPDLLLRGSGSGKQSGSSLLDLLKSPLTLQLDLGGRGRIADLLNSLHLAAPAADAQGFTTLRTPVQLSGSFAGFDSNDFWASLARLAANNVGGGDNLLDLLLKPKAPPPAQPASP